MAYNLYLEDVHIREIPEDYLKSINLVAQDMKDAELLDLWRKKISGSKIKDIKTRPITTLGYMLGLVDDKTWQESINAIPRIAAYREFGKRDEWTLLDLFNHAIRNEWQDQIEGQERKMKLRDLMIDSSATKRLQKEFAPNIQQKNYVFTDKRTLFMDNEASPMANLFMMNIDGYTLNPNGTIKHIVEIKSKTGMLNNSTDWASYMDLHLDQITFYAQLAGSTDGAVLLVGHAKRGMKTHFLSKKDLDANWENLKDYLNRFSTCLQAIRDKKLGEKVVTPDNLEKLLTIINWGDPSAESITREMLLERARRLVA